jgi:AraC family ethanolamine operon transcriptional activator
MGRAWVIDRAFSYHSMAIDSIDGLRHPVDGADAEIVQLGSGHISGRLTRATIGEVSFSKGSFSLPIRASGVLSPIRLTVGVLLECASPLKARLGIGKGGDILVNPPGFDHHNVFTGEASFAGLSIDLIEIAMMFSGEGALSDPAFWSRPAQYRPRNPYGPAAIELRLRPIFASLAKRTTTLPGATADFLKRAVVEAFAAPMLDASVIQESSTIASTVKIIREVEHYVDARPFRPIHISELCSHLKISRRTLHRCFEDVLGIGPGAFLRQRRLCSVHSALRRLDARTTHVTKVATDFGFLELGRFARQYHLLFGEYPNQTLRR